MSFTVTGGSFCGSPQGGPRTEGRACAPAFPHAPPPTPGSAERRPRVSPLWVSFPSELSEVQSGVHRSRLSVLLILAWGV